MTPGELAVVDQALAEFGNRLDVFVTVYVKLREKHGAAQASADMCALFNSLPAMETSATLAAAVARLAEEGA